MSGPPTAKFSATRKGLDFAINKNVKNLAVKATQGGKVVYAGNGIGGYERLIIVKHSESLLSAYSFDGRVTVQEQIQVKAGEKIADIRYTGRKQQVMHFELRQRGQPVDPTRWLSPTG